MTNSEPRTATAAHTPGPWVVLAVEDFIEICPAMRPGDICKIERSPFEGSGAANAFLILAAPDMFKALQVLAAIPFESIEGLRDASDDVGVCGVNAHKICIGHIRDARAAIAKATGAVGDQS